MTSLSLVRFFATRPASSAGLFGLALRRHLQTTVAILPIVLPFPVRRDFARWVCGSFATYVPLPK
ncbi:MAG TPA: hypothetical protein VEK07_09425 [Polyangiaceae bacterium]|nr:hypothetical protein [Polyangiaceae bacterium]